MAGESSVAEDTRSHRVVVQVRLEHDYDAFVRDAKVGPTLSGLAELLEIAPNEISLLSLRAGCTILVISLPEAAAEKLLRDGVVIPPITGLTEEQVAILRTAVKVRKGTKVEATPYVSGFPDIDPHITWLHLSDLHIKEDYTDPKSDTNAELGRFIEDLPKCLGNAGIVPDAVFFTGDVAHAGLPKQYEAAEKFFRDIKNSLPSASRKAPFLAIPGNHDINWKDIPGDPEREMRNRLKKGEKLADIAREYRSHIAKRHKNFGDFSRRFNTTSCKWIDGSNAFSHTFTAGSRKVKLGVAGFNSAWLSTRKNLLEEAGIDQSYGDLDLQHLVLGTEQIRSVRNAIKDTHLRVALVHHELMSQWYRDEDRQLQRQEMKLYDFVLRGHQHEPQARQGIKVAGADDYMELAPGALRTWPPHFQGFMAVELDFVKRWMRITAWTVTGHSHDWVLDQEFGMGGVELRPLPSRLCDRLP